MTKDPLARKETIFVFVIFFLAFLLRFIYLNQLAHQSPYFFLRGSTLDPGFYSSWAIAIAQGDIIGRGVFQAMPLYPYFLGFLYFVTNFSLFSARLFQFFLGSFSVVLIYFLAREVFSKKAAVIAALIACFYGPLIFYEGMFVPSSLIVFLYLLSAIALLKLKDAKNTLAWPLCGALIGITALANASVLFALALSPLMLPRKNIKNLAYLFIGALLVISAATARNYLVGKDLVLISSQAGVNFYIGNNESSGGHFASIGQAMQGSEELIRDSRALAERSARERLKPSDISAYWAKRALSFITKHPLRYAGLLARKSYFFWNGFEYPDVEDYYFARGITPFLRTGVFSFWVVAPFAIVGIFYSIRQKKDALVLYIFLASVIAGLLLFFVNSRYRMAAVPFVAVFAGFAVSSLIDILRQREFKKAAVFMLIFLLSFLFVNSGAQRPDFAQADYNLSALYFNRGEYDNAIKSAYDALDVNQSMLPARYILGMAFFYKGDALEAKRQFNAALELDSGFAQGYAGLGEVYLSQGEVEKAVKAFQKAVSIDPHDFISRMQLGNVYYKKGDMEAAREQYMQVLSIQPSNNIARQRLKKIQER